MIVNITTFTLMHLLISLVAISTGLVLALFAWLGVAAFRRFRPDVVVPARVAMPAAGAL